MQCVPERSVRLSVYLFSSKLSFMLKLWWIISESVLSNTCAFVGVIY